MIQRFAKFEKFLDMNDLLYSSAFLLQKFFDLSNP
jgi:hypothetical protein